jgi:lipopolysaccharide transport system permease protein
MTTLIEWDRGALMYGKLPGLGQIALLTLAAGAIAGLGFAFFRRLQSGFVDEL